MHIQHFVKVPSYQGEHEMIPRPFALEKNLSGSPGFSPGARVSHTKLMPSTRNDTFSKICHSKPPHTHVISPLRDCLETLCSFKQQ